VELLRAPRVDLVWTGPERVGSSTRDTKIVVAELFGRARRSVLVSSYSLASGATLFAPLAARMVEVPSLRRKRTSRRGCSWRTGCSRWRSRSSSMTS
jgi:hypothetical protein